MTSESDPESTSNTDTGGGAHVGGNVDAGNDFVGRDKLTEQNTTNDSSVKIALATDGSTISNSTITIGSIYQNAPSSPAILESEAPAPGESPYRGMEYFDVDDADLFFGREQLTTELVEHLRHNPLLAIVGASGSGKSSLARAGLIPALQGTKPLIDNSQPPKGSSRWAYHIITPTSHPLESLAASLTRHSESVTATSTLIDDLRKDARSLHLAARRVVNGEQRLLLLVDQFEELFTLCKDEAEQQAFVANLLHAAQPDGVVTLVLTLRADFYHHCAKFPELRNALETQQKYIGAMSSDELRRAIEEPAKAGKWEFQEGLVEQLLSDVGDEPGALPLLSHALLETWKRRSGRRMTLAGYSASGKVQGAIAKTADVIYHDFSEPQQRIARTIFLRLTELGEGSQDTRRRVRPDELELTNINPDEVQIVLKNLANARLVTIDDESVQVAHEALIRYWGTLRKWLDEDREGHHIQRRLTEAALEWEEQHFDERLLYQDPRLAQVKIWLENGNTSNIGLNKLEREFLTHSEDNATAAQRREDERRQAIIAQKARADEQTKISGRLRRLLVLLALVTLFAVVATFIAANQRKDALTERSNAIDARQTAEAARLSAEVEAKRAKAAESAEKSLRIKEKELNGLIQTDFIQKMSWQIRQEQPSLALLLATEAVYRQQPRGEPHLTSATDNLFNLLQEISGTPLIGHTDAINDLDFSPDGAWLASASKDQTIRLWSVANFFAKPIVLQKHTMAVNAIAYNTTGKILASGGEDGAIYLWTIDKNEQQPLLLNQSVAAVNDVLFSPDGQWFASASEDGVLRLWSQEATDGISITMQIDNFLSSIAFHTNEPWLVTGGLDGVKLINLDEVEKQPLTLLSESTKKVAFSMRGNWLAALTKNGTLDIWKIGKSIQEFKKDNSPFLSIDNFSFEPSDFLDNYITIVTHENILDSKDLWSKLTNSDFSYRRANGNIATLTYNFDGTLLATASVDGSIRLLGQLTTFSFDPLLESLPNSETPKYIFSYGCRCTSGSKRGNACTSSSFCGIGGACRCPHKQLDTQSLLQLSCGRAGRNLTQDEWMEYFPNEHYRAICPQWSVGSQ